MEAVPTLAHHTVQQCRSAECTVW